ncbi:MAG: TatD family hydrolase [Solirubrobacterales bacterium]
MVDTHSHVARCQESPEEILEQAGAAGLTRILSVGLDEENNREQIALVEKFDQVYAAVGRHPNDADGFDQAAADDIEMLAAHEKVVAIGETGLDFFRDTANPENQRVAFAAQIDIASRLELPIVIHVRDPQGKEDAVAEAFTMLDAAGDGLEVILHCFSAPAYVDRAVDRGWYCSFAGNVTYPANEDLRAAAAKVPENLILAETDAPYLTPQSRRRSKNQPAFVVETAELLAELRGVTYDDFDSTVTANAERVFGW